MAATTNENLVDGIYTRDAVLADEGCYGAGPATWQGLDKIKIRYKQDLPRFVTLQHVPVDVRWNTGVRWTTTSGWATGETVGTWRAGASTQLQVIKGHEAWSFVKDSGRWRINSFTFGRC